MKLFKLSLPTCNAFVEEDMGGIKRILDAHKLEGWKWLASYTFLVAKTIVLVCQTKFLIEEWENFSIFSSAAAMYFIPILVRLRQYNSWSLYF